MTPPASAAASAPHTRPGFSPRPRVTPPRPRRVSGPARSPARARARPLPPPAEQGLALGVAGLARRVSGHRALDRLITSRLWIGLIAFALIGIVALQLLVLRLNSSIGDSLVRAASLQRANAALSIEGSELASGERVEAHAAHLGMQLVPIGSLLFLTSDPRSDLERAAGALNTPAHGASQTGSTTATSASGTSSTASTATPSASSATTGGEQPAGSNASTAGASEAAAGTGTSAEAPATSTAGAAGSAPAVSASSTPSATTPTSEGGATPAGTGATATPVGAGGGVGAGQTNGSG